MAAPKSATPKPPAKLAKSTEPAQPAAYAVSSPLTLPAKAPDISQEVNNEDDLAG